MSEPDQPLTPLGQLLEAGRERASLSKRAAAKLAGISEGRWRQVVTGIQKAGDVNVPVNPRRNTVTAMANAVGVNPTEALEAAGITPIGGPEPRTTDDDDPAIVRVMRSPLSDDTKRKIVAMLIREKEQAEQERLAHAEELLKLMGDEG